MVGKDNSLNFALLKRHTANERKHTVTLQKQLDSSFAPFTVERTNLPEDAGGDDEDEILNLTTKNINREENAKVKVFQ